VKFTEIYFMLGEFSCVELEQYLISLCFEALNDATFMPCMPINRIKTQASVSPGTNMFQT